MIHKQRLFNERGGEKGIPIREEFQQRWYVMPSPAGNKSSMRREQLPPLGPHRATKEIDEWVAWKTRLSWCPRSPRPHLSYNTALIKEGADAHRSSRRHGAVSNSLSAAASHDGFGCSLLCCTPLRMWWYNVAQRYPLPYLLWIQILSLVLESV